MQLCFLSTGYALEQNQCNCSLKQNSLFRGRVRRGLRRDQLSLPHLHTTVLQLSKQKLHSLLQIWSYYFEQSQTTNLIVFQKTSWVWISRCINVCFRIGNRNRNKKMQNFYYYPPGFKTLTWYQRQSDCTLRTKEKSLLKVNSLGASTKCGQVRDFTKLDSS